MSMLLALLSVLVGLFGLVLSSQVAAGPSVVGFAILMAVWARLAQAHDHHKAWQAAQRHTAPSAPTTVT